MACTFDLGVLEFCFVPRNGDARSTLIEAVDLAAAAERLGCTRYWLGEHHALECASPAPEVLVPVMAGTTSRIPVGATVLLGYHSPFRVAERFKVLEALFPHRVELLIGRGGPLKAEYADLLAPRSGLDECEEDGIRRAQALRDFLVGRPLPVPPPVASEPAVWVLSGTGMSARIAAATRSRLSLALFFRSAPKPEWVHEYRTRMRALDCEPLVNMAVAGVCASTSEEAHRLLHLGISERRLGFEARVVGSPCECRTAIEELACAYGVSEVMFLDMSPSIETRVRSLEHLAGALA